MTAHARGLIKLMTWPFDAFSLTFYYLIFYCFRQSLVFCHFWFPVFVCTFQGSRNITSQVKKLKLGEIKWWKHFALPPNAAISGDKHASTRRQLLSDNGQRVISPVGGFASDLQSSIGMVFTKNSQHLIPLKAGSVSETSFTPYFFFF